jgi:hypothetical protein
VALSDFLKSELDSVTDVTRWNFGLDIAIELLPAPCAARKFADSRCGVPQRPPSYSGQEFSRKELLPPAWRNTAEFAKTLSAVSNSSTLSLTQEGEQ